MGSPPSPSRAPRPVRALGGLAVAVIAAYVVWTVPGVRNRPHFDVAFDGVLHGGGYLLVAALAVIAGVRTRATVGWWFVVGAVVLRALGFAVSLSFLAAHHPLAYPSVADAMWVLSGLALITAVVIRLRELVARVSTLVLLDAATAALLAAGLAIAVLTHPVSVLSAPGIARSAVITNVVYPVLDAALLVVVAAVLATQRLRLCLSEWLFAAGIAALVVVDVVYFVQVADGTWRPGSLLASLSLLATAVITAAVWAWPGGRRATRTERRDPALRAPRPVPTGSTVTALLGGLTLTSLVWTGLADGPRTAFLVFGLAGAVTVARGLVTLQLERQVSGEALDLASGDLRRFHALVEASTDFIGMADPDGRVIYLNPAGRRMIGVPAEEDITRYSVVQLIPAVGADTFHRRWPKLLEVGSWQGESRLEPLDGGPPVPVAVSSFVIYDPVTHAPFAVATIQRDITEQHSTQAAMRDLAEQRERLLGRLVQAQEDERSRIAADVHDDSVQVLAAVGLRLTLLRRRLLASTAGAEDELLGTVDRVQEAVAAATGRLRDLLFDLESPARESGLRDSLTEAAAFVFADTGVRWEITGEPTLDLPQAERVTAFRIAKEAMVNARKHAGARTVTVRLELEQDSVAVTVRDDGRGIEDDADRARPGHLGLASMRDRAEVAGGRMEVRRLDEGGTEVRLILPRPSRAVPERS